MWSSWRSRQQPKTPLIEMADKGKGKARVSSGPSLEKRGKQGVFNINHLFAQENFIWSSSGSPNHQGKGDSSFGGVFTYNQNGTSIHHEKNPSFGRARHFRWMQAGHGRMWYRIAGDLIERHPMHLRWILLSRKSGSLWWLCSKTRRSRRLVLGGKMLCW